MTFILLDYTLYLIRKLFRIVKNIVIASAIIVIFAFIKYKPAYEVTLSGEKLGFVEDKNLIEAKIEKYMNDTSGNIAFREIASLPEYNLKLVDRRINDNNQYIMGVIDEMTTTTYKVYAITTDDQETAIVTSVPEAEEIINTVKQGVDEEAGLKLGIVDKYTTELNVTEKNQAIAVLNQYKDVKVNEYNSKKAEEERIRLAKLRSTSRRSTSLAKSISTTTNAAPSGSISGMSLSIPVSGSISSRFGSRSSVRSSVHTGLDIATPMGTGIRPVSAGTVVFAAYNGSYGNLIKISHGNGVETWYAHCSSIYVSVGQSVDVGTTIGAVGSTGNSTGPHLHLEIRINGVPVNPQNYLYN